MTSSTFLQKLFYAIWTIPAFIFFSICIGKRAIYLLPLYPVFALLLARSIIELLESDRVQWRRWTAVCWALVLLVFSLAPMVLHYSKYSAYWDNRLYVFMAYTVFCSLITFGYIYKKNTQSLVKLMGVQFSTLLLFAATFLFPLMNTHKSAKAFCAPLRMLTDANISYALYSLGFTREEYIYYADHFHGTLLNGILPIPENEGYSQREIAEFQSNLLQDIRKVVENVDVKSITSLSDEELLNLQKAIKENVEISPENSAMTIAFEEAMATHLEQIFNAISVHPESFIMVQDNDWRWILAFYPDARSLPILMDTNIGSRHVLLVTTQQGEKMINAQNAQPIIAINAPTGGINE